MLILSLRSWLIADYVLPSIRSEPSVLVMRQALHFTLLQTATATILIPFINTNAILLYLFGRYNLDPEKQRTDNELWHSLEISQLRETVSQMPKGLGE